MAGKSRPAEGQRGGSGRDRVRLYRRPGNELTYRFPLIVEAQKRLRSRSCTIDRKEVCCDDNGVPSFDRIRYRRYDDSGSCTRSI